MKWRITAPIWQAPKGWLFEDHDQLSKPTDNWVWDGRLLHGGTELLAQWATINDISPEELPGLIAELKAKPKILWIEGNLKKNPADRGSDSGSPEDPDSGEPGETIPVYGLLHDPRVVDVDLQVDNINICPISTLSGDYKVHIVDPLNIRNIKRWELHKYNYWPDNESDKTWPFIYITPDARLPYQVFRVKTWSILDMKPKPDFAELPKDEINILPPESSVEWSARVYYERYKENELTNNVPMDGYTLLNDTEWENGRSSVYWDFRMYLENGVSGRANPCNRTINQNGIIWGGEAGLKWTILAKNEVILNAGAIPYSIRGQNPSVNTVEDEIRGLITTSEGLKDDYYQLQDSYMAILRGENGWPGRGIYPQYNWIDTHGKEYGPTPNHIRNERSGNGVVGSSRYHIHNANHSDDSYSIGLSHITWALNNSNLWGQTLPDITWNWTINLTAGIDLYLKEKVVVAKRHMKDERDAAVVIINGQSVPVPVPETRIAGKISGGDNLSHTVISPELATSVQYYNSWSAGPLFQWDRENQKWVLHNTQYAVKMIGVWP